MKHTQPLHGSDTAASPVSVATRTQVALLIDEEGVIRECSKGAEEMFRGGAKALVGSHVSKFISRFSGADAFHGGELEPKLEYLCHCGAPFRAIRCDGTAFVGEICVANHVGRKGNHVRLVVLQTSPRCDPTTPNVWCLG